MDIQLPQIRITPPDLTQANEALDKMAEQLQGIRVFSAAEIMAIRAAAYDEGFTACAGEHMQQQKDASHPITRLNPYRENA